MTLNDIIVSALAQLDRGHDAQTLDIWRDKFTRFANEAVVDLAGLTSQEPPKPIPAMTAFWIPMPFPCPAKSCSPSPGKESRKPSAPALPPASCALEAARVRWRFSICMSRRKCPRPPMRPACRPGATG